MFSKKSAYSVKKIIAKIKQSICLTLQTVQNQTLKVFNQEQTSCVSAITRHQTLVHYRLFQFLRACEQ